VESEGETWVCFAISPLIYHHWEVRNLNLNLLKFWCVYKHIMLCIYYEKLSIMCCVVWKYIFNLKLCFWTRIRVGSSENCGKLERKHVSPFNGWTSAQTNRKMNLITLIVMNCVSIGINKRKRSKWYKNLKKNSCTSW
jgi:hypothetical protein